MPLACKTHPHRLFFLGLPDPASLYDCAYGFFARAAVGGATVADAGAKSILDRLATSCCSERRFWSSAFEKESGDDEAVRKDMREWQIARAMGIRHWEVCPRKRPGWKVPGRIAYAEPWHVRSCRREGIAALDIGRWTSDVGHEIRAPVQPITYSHEMRKRR